MSDKSTQTPLSPPSSVNPDAVPPTILRPKGDPKIIQAWKTILRDLEADKENLPPAVYDFEKANAERYLKEEEGHDAHRLEHVRNWFRPSQHR